MQFNVQMVILGNGDPYYEHNLTEIAKRYPDKLKVILAFDVKLAQRIYAGADSFLMPSALPISIMSISPQRGHELV